MRPHRDGASQRAPVVLGWSWESGLFNPDLDDVADRLDEAVRSAGGGSSVCPEERSEGVDQAAENGDDDGDDGPAGVPARVV